MRRGAVALLVLLVAVATSGSADAAPRHAADPYQPVADHCVRFRAGDTGMAVSADESLTAFVPRWTFTNGAGGYHGFEYRAWAPHEVTQRAGGDTGRWRGFSVQPIEEIRLCATGPGFGPPLA